MALLSLIGSLFGILIWIQPLLVNCITFNLNGQYWANGCDFRENNFQQVNVPSDKCGGKCASTNGCTHFTWTSWNGGTCFMKSGSVNPSDAFATDDPTMVCGYLNNPDQGGVTVGPVMNGVLATRHAATEAGACQLPEGDYSTGIHPVALGNIEALQSLKHRPGLCGHILRVNCGNVPVDIIVSNANLGGGLDLYASTWNLATGGKPPGEATCSVQMTRGNPFKFEGPRCYYSPEGEKNNPYFQLLGLFNTGDRTVAFGTLDGRRGDFNSITSYLAFYGGPVSQDAQVIFQFTDGSSHSVPLRDCVKENKLHIWS